MRIFIEASTKLDYQVPKQDLDLMAGRMAGVCYMKEDLLALRQESEANSLNRAQRTKRDKHHSVFDHSYLTISLEGVPKLFAMLLNNEKVYTTSEKSARYTKMQLSQEEQYLYDKWYEKIKFLIIEHYGGSSKFFSESKVDTLAQENARYFTSVMTPTSMEYTVSYRQLNYLCAWLKDIKEEKNPLYKMLVPVAEEFVERMDNLGYLDDELMMDGKGRGLSLIAKRARQEQFGEMYCVNSKASAACFAQIQRHRTLSYEIMLDENPEYFVPLLLNEYPNLAEEWLNDMKLVAHLFPQATLLNINERGSYENLILKAKERLCSHTQLEAMLNTKQNIERMIKNTDNEYVRKDLQNISNGARCTFGFKCEKPCGFKEGIDLSRII